MSSPIEEIASLTIGTVESVSPSEIRVLLESNAPQTTALNTGVPLGFPRINGYVLIPNESGSVVCQVVWLGIERAAFPKRTGLKDFGLIDLPFPTRKIHLNPVGTLTACRDDEESSMNYELKRGVVAFPSVGDSAVLPTADQLRCIIEAAKSEDRRLKIGTSPLSGNVAVTVDPNKLFGRHLAVLGNTGSGKSCTVAGLIRWSLSQASEQLTDGKRPNGRFIVLDPNGEYSRAFKDWPGVRRFGLSSKSPDTRQFRLPAWILNSYEWSAFTHAKAGVQRPVLMSALRELRKESSADDRDRHIALSVLLRSYYRSIVNDQRRGAVAYMEKPGKNDFGQKLHAISRSLEQWSKIPELSDMKSLLMSTSASLKSVADKRYKTFKNEQGELVEYYQAFDTSEVDSVVESIDRCTESLPVAGQDLGINEDTPLRFAPSHLPEVIAEIALEQGQAQFVDTLVLRVNMLLSDQRLSPVLAPDPEVTLKEWLDDILGGSDSETLSIIDLSLISSDVLHLTIAVVARVIFEAIQRYRKVEGHELPTALVLEEAHTFVKRRQHSESDIPTASDVCCETFERIAREGRKFGLGLVLASQRPSELSATVLAQCNTFLLHRIVNDRDQELVGKLVPDNLGELLKELPSLPSRQAILLGWAATVPTLVEIAELPEEHRPQSADPEFWDVWTRVKERKIDWGKIVDDWTGARPKTSEGDGKDGTVEDVNLEEQA